MTIIARGIKRGDVRTFQESFVKGYQDIWATEVDTDFDRLFDAWNSGLSGDMALADNSVTNAKLADGSVTNSKLALNSVSSANIIDGAIATIDIADLAVTDAKIASLAWSKITGAPAFLPDAPVDGKQYARKDAAWTAVVAGGPPTGPAGGVLAGTYPDPTLAANAVISANITDFNVTGSKLSGGAVTTDKLSPSPALPADVGKMITVGPGGTFAYAVVPSGGGGAPTGPAGGHLLGTYPNPTVVAAQSGFLVAEIADQPTSSTTAAWRANVLASAPGYNQATVGWGYTAWLTGSDRFEIFRRAAGGTAQTVFLTVLQNGTIRATTDPVNALDLATKQYVDNKAPGGTAGGDLTGSYPNPTIGPGKVTRAQTAADLWLPPVPTGSDVAKVLTVTAGPAIAWQSATGAAWSLAANVIQPTDPTAWAILAATPTDGTATAGAGLRLQGFSNLGSGREPYISIRRGRSGPAAPQINHTLGRLSIEPYINTTTVAECSQMQWLSTETHATSARGSDFSLTLCPTGTSNQNTILSFSNAGVFSLQQAGVTRLTLDATGNLILPGVNRNMLTWGSRTIKGRLIASGSDDRSAWSINCALNSGDVFYTVDDATRPSWATYLLANAGGGVNDGVVWYHGVAGSSPTTEYMRLDGAGKLTIPGPAPGDTTDQATIIIGQRVPRTRLFSFPGIDLGGFSLNTRFNNSAWVQDDVAKSSWMAYARTDQDRFAVDRIAAGGAASTLLYVEGATGSLYVRNPADNGVIVFGPQLANSWINIVNNLWAPADATRSSWSMSAQTVTSGAGDIFAWYRRAPAAGAGTSNTIAYLDGAGNFVITGATATKASGTTWANPSDDRVKKDVVSYTTGLAAILQLDPISYTYNGKGGTIDNVPGMGFSAQAVQPIMPEMVLTIHKKLDPADETEIDLLMLDTTALPLALVNAVKELANRVTALEAK